MKNILVIMLAIIQLSACSQSQKEMKKLVYIMDSQCGWCYGNSDNMNAVYNKFKDIATIEVVVGGLWLNQNAPTGGDGLSQFIESHAPRMEQTTGVPIGAKYYELVKDSSYTFSSLEPSAAIVLIKQISPESAFNFSKDVQKALYVKGKKLDELATYIPILEKYSIDLATFKKQWLSTENLNAVNAEFKRASTLANGFPTLILQDKDTSTVLASGYFNLENMVNLLNEQL